MRRAARTDFVQIDSLVERNSTRRDSADADNQRGPLLGVEKNARRTQACLFAAIVASL